MVTFSHWNNFGVLQILMLNQSIKEELIASKKSTSKPFQNSYWNYSHLLLYLFIFNKDRAFIENNSNSILAYQKAMFLGTGREEIKESVKNA